MVRNPDKDKDIIISRLKQQGCRITKQRLMLLDVILEEDCSSCKEIYYKAVKRILRLGLQLYIEWLIHWKKSVQLTVRICTE